MESSVLREIAETRKYLDEWFFHDISQTQAARNIVEKHISRLEALINDSTPDDDPFLRTPNRYSFADDKSLVSPSLASPPVSRATINYDRILDEVSARGGATAPTGARQSQLNGGDEAAADPSAAGDARKRPTPESVQEEKRNRSPLTDAACYVLVAFKRDRVLQFESGTYVAPGEYVVVGGDRGEDIGLVTHTFMPGERDSNGEKWAEGAGSVLRVASALEVSQLQGVQMELEERAVEVAQKKVEEHELPMCIVDAEYQFDRKKLTFYYRSQGRLDFRNLVRDLYKTFRARIWMEQDGPS